jgi:hypothetical protein
MLLRKASEFCLLEEKYIVKRNLFKDIELAAV